MISSKMSNTKDNNDISQTAKLKHQEKLNSPLKVFDTKVERRYYNILKSYMANLSETNSNVTMTSVSPTYMLLESEIKAHVKYREAMFRDSPRLLPSKQVSNISHCLLRFSEYIEAADVLQLIYYRCMTKIIDNTNNFIFKTDETLLMKELLNITKFSDDEKLRILKNPSLRVKLLLFFDKLYPVYDYIVWVERNYQNFTSDYKTIFAYYVLKTLTLNEETYNSGIETINKISLHADITCKNWMKDSFKQIFRGKCLINKFYVVANYQDDFKTVFTKKDSDVKRVTSEDIIRTHYYIFDPQNGSNSNCVLKKVESRNTTSNRKRRGNYNARKNYRRKDVCKQNANMSSVSHNKQRTGGNNRKSFRKN